MLTRLPILAIAAALLAATISNSTGAVVKIPALFYSLPKPSGELGGVDSYTVEYKSGNLRDDGRFEVSSSQTLTIFDVDGAIDFYFAVAERYITTAPPAGDAAKAFEVTGTYVQDIGGIAITYYGIKATGGGGGKGGTNLTGKPAKIYKSSTKLAKQLNQAQKLTGAQAQAILKNIIKSLTKVAKMTKQEVAEPSRDFILHPSMIRNVEKAKSLAERAARSPEEKARDRSIEASQRQIDILNRKLEKIGR